MNRSMLFILVALVVLLGACSPATPTPDGMMKKETPTGEAMMQKETPATDAMMKLPDQIFAAHFVDASPKHGDAVGKAPAQVAINFNFTLSDVSTIVITKDDKPVETSKVVLASNKLAMSAALPASAGDGLYVVKYKACWPDKSCHNGLFAFKVDSKMAK